MLSASVFNSARALTVYTKGAPPQKFGHCVYVLIMSKDVKVDAAEDNIHSEVYFVFVSRSARCSMHALMPVSAREGTINLLFNFP